MHRVLFEETNLVGNVYFTNYVKWQGHCRESFLMDHAPVVVNQLQTGELALVTVNVTVDYLDEAFAGDPIEILMGLEGRAGQLVTMKFLYARGGQPIAVGRQTVACMRRDPLTRKLAPAPVPQPLLDAFEF